MAVQTRCRKAHVSSVALVIHASRPDAASLASQTAQWLSAMGHEVDIVEPELNQVDDLTGEGSGSGSNIGMQGSGIDDLSELELQASPIDNSASGLLKGADLAVSLGGDGTMLRTVGLALSSDVPVLGVNLGHLGYLTELEPSLLRSGLERFLAGDYEIEERMTLRVRLERTPGHAQACVEYVALNEAVVEKLLPGHTVRLAASIAGKPFVTYAADGLLVATPTGTTAYNLSARGPIASPKLNALVVTPISPHMLFDRTLVLDPSEQLQLQVAGPRSGVLVIDGMSAGRVRPGDTVLCEAGSYRALLVRFSKHSFHSVLRERFHLADG